MFVSFVEIYNEHIYDLLEPLPKDKKKKRTILGLAEDKKLPFVKGLREIQVVYFSVLVLNFTVNILDRQ